MRGLRLSRAAGIRVGASALVLLAGIASVIYIHGNASAAQGTAFARVPYNSAHSAPVPSGAELLGHHSAKSQMQIEIVLHPQHESNLLPLIQALSTPGNAHYHQWLTPAQFNAAFPAPAFNTSWLTSHGIQQVAGPSPLVLAFKGTAGQFEAAFGTTINDYRTKAGHTVYANTTAPSVPSSVFSEIAGIIGLDNVTSGQVKPQLTKPLKLSGNAAQPAYGDGPDDSGLTPSQFRGIYNANAIYGATTGQGETTAVFELSGYQESDIRVYEKQFGLPKTKIQNINVDGGACSPEILQENGAPCGYAASEDELDIEFQDAMAPGVSKIQVYLGPNSDQGVIDTYFAIANQDTADAISSSWGECEAALASGDASGEFLAFAQMAAQGQSISASSGDNGAYDCLDFQFNSPPLPPYTENEAVDDPASDPLMTAVGGTSFFGTFDPGTTNLNPTYPTGDEYVWDLANNCKNSDYKVFGIDISSQFGQCPLGAGGGGNSTLWPKAPWQTGPGTTSSASQYGAYCGQASGVECREVPDISLNADPFSGYAEYCSDTDDSFCTGDPWFQIGGTSCSSPLWSGIVALADSYGHQRIGLPTILLYGLDSPAGYSHDLHDMSGGAKYTFDWTGILQTYFDQTKTFQPVHYFTNKNGVGSPPGFVETPNYDMATGLGTPNIGGLVPALAQFQ